VKKIDIVIRQKPIYIEYNCPYCEEFIYILYADFIAIFDEPCDWDGSVIFCKNCDKPSEIKYWEFD